MKKTKGILKDYHFTELGLFSASSLSCSGIHLRIFNLSLFYRNLSVPEIQSALTYFLSLGMQFLIVNNPVQ